MSKSVNKCLSRWPFRYTDLPFILKHCRKNDWIAQLDLRSFFLQLPMAADFQKYLSLRCPLTGKLLKYARVPFGLATAPAWASAVSSEVRRLMRARGLDTVFCYVDDFFFICPTKAACAEALRIALEVLADLGFPVSAEKVVQPAQVSEILGVVLNTVDGTLGVKEEHADWCLRLINEVLEKGHLKKRLFHSLCGTLNWVCALIRGSRPYLRTMWDALAARRNSSARVHLSEAARTDLLWWRARLLQLNEGGCTTKWLDTSSMDLAFTATDASGVIGCGLWLEDELYAHLWDDEQREWSVPRQELFPVAVAFERFGESLHGKMVVIITDSITNVFAINAGSSSSPECNKLLKRMSIAERHWGFESVAVWMPREFNAIPDALSKFTIPGAPLCL